jgi:hypothetical protein
LAHTEDIEPQYDDSLCHALVYLDSSVIIKAGLDRNVDRVESGFYDTEEVYVEAVDELIRLPQQRPPTADIQIKLSILKKIRDAAAISLNIAINQYTAKIHNEPSQDKDPIYDVIEMQTLLLHGMDSEIWKVDDRNAWGLIRSGRLSFRSFYGFRVGGQFFECKYRRC